MTSETVPMTTVDVPDALRAYGIESLREVVIDRATVIVSVWLDGMTIVGSFCGGGSPEVARQKAMQRALEHGLRLRARWAVQKLAPGTEQAAQRQAQDPTM